MTATSGRATQDGFDLWTLQTDAVHIAVCPELGGKVVSLRDRRRDREWMWAPPGRPLGQQPIGTPYDRGPMAGIDECLPTVGPCTVERRDMPDHGEAWARAWDVVSADEQGITLALELDCLPLTFERNVRVQDAVVRLDYALTNTANHPVDYVWCLHPLFAIRDGDAIALQPGPGAGRIDGGLGLPGLEPDGPAKWPSPVPSVAIDRMDLGPLPACVKLFTPSPQEPSFRIEDTTHADPRTQLACRYGPREALPYLGVWLTRGGLHGFHHVALEPTNAPFDHLDKAIAHTESPTQLSAHETRRWWVEYEVCSQ
ncbi:MAG: hypothetical protein AAGA57_11160 [Planctomycetota bacterium]